MKKVKKGIRVYLGYNMRADEYGEDDKMLQIYNENDVTDFIFNDKKELKSICSEFSKEEVKEQLNKIVDEFYKSYD